jgi:hypothetical protein
MAEQVGGFGRFSNRFPAKVALQVQSRDRIVAASQGNQGVFHKGG